MSLNFLRLKERVCPFHSRTKGLGSQEKWYWFRLYRVYCDMNFVQSTMHVQMKNLNCGKQEDYFFEILPVECEVSHMRLSLRAFRRFGYQRWNFLSMPQRSLTTHSQFSTINWKMFTSGGNDWSFYAGRGNNSQPIVDSIRSIGYWDNRFRGILI